ncbi:type IV pilus modification PilV family protein [Jeotgalibacillus soli]|uniref:Prepilin-type N-terminal cleavage/methylation domain-containing protein n=1 Tax=Jeotgalibacillus soli TaxID=889306 RepID=A0A0C2VJ65_9BACL|nr:prepilin-type N-terminal cleavage/methylation domain-containing protein [Jeotgalibacillus soli]KIL44516.1 hypothetical protein KP78_34800 [Jeotgalibacillus soli]
MVNFCKERANSNGFTLTELLVTIVLISIVIIGFISFFSQSVLFSTKVETVMTASNKADKIAHDIKASDQVQSWIDAHQVRTCSDVHNIDLPARLIDGSIEGEYGYYLSINDERYYPNITICRHQEEMELSLFLLHIEVYKEADGEMEFLTELFDYIEVDE